MYAGVAAPGLAGWVVDQTLGRVDTARPTDQILMGDKTPAALCLEHVIGQNPLFGDIPVGLDLVLLDVLVDGRTDRLS